MTLHPTASAVRPPSPDATRAYTPSRRSMGALLLGRAGFRGLWMAAPLLLATTWTPQQLGSTVAAIGSFGWLTLLLAGSEKTLLKQVPRLPRLSGQVVLWSVLIVAVPLGVALVAATTSTITGVGPTLLLWGVVWGLTGALFQTVAAIHRLAHRVPADVLMFSAGGAWVVAATGATFVADLDPVSWIVTCLAGLLAIAVVSLASVPRSRFRGPRRRAATAPIRRSLLVLSLPEVLSIAGVSAGFWAIAAFAAEVEATRYYVAVTVAGVFGATAGFLVRLHQPDISLRLRGTGAAAGETAARRILDRAVTAGVATAAVALAAHALGAPWWTTLALLTVGEIVVFTQRTVAANLIENARSRWLPGNVAASACGLAAAGVVLLLATERWGALAAMAALVTAQLCNALALRLLLRRPSARRVHAPPRGELT